MADPGFPRGGGANSPGGGAPTYNFAKISQKLHEMERIWTPGGGGGRASKILLCRSTTGRVSKSVVKENELFIYQYVLKYGMLKYVSILQHTVVCKRYLGGATVAPGSICVTTLLDDDEDVCLSDLVHFKDISTTFQAVVHTVRNFNLQKKSRNFNIWCRFKFKHLLNKNAFH